MLPMTYIQRMKPGALLLLSVLLTAGSAWADNRYDDTSAYEADASYSFARVVEGSSTLFLVDGERERVETHQPILVGDRLWVPEDSRIEVVLADHSLLRAEGEAEITFETVAWSAETEDRETSLIVREGRIQLVVPEAALGDALPRIVTPDATLYVHREGSFRIDVGYGWTELVVRSGLAEIVTRGDSRLVHPGEMGWVESGTRRARSGRSYESGIVLQAAGGRDALERWGDRLSEEAHYAEATYVDEPLRYVAAPLNHHGVWIDIGGYHAWRPRVEVSWRPYYRGYWRHTPLGYTWVSADPWGWVTHHYGSWDYVAGYGWVWYPGRHYAPARVHWYWGPSYVGWVPSGYYGHYYGHHHSGFSLSFGHYGWVSLGWDPFDHWTFTTTVYFGRYHDHHGHYGYGDHGRYGHKGYGHHYSGADLVRDRAPFERGIITANPGVERREAKDVYPNLKGQLTELRKQRGKDLPDVDSFIAKKPMPDDVSRVVLTKPDSPTSLKPGAVRPKPRTGVLASKPAGRSADKPAVVGTGKPSRPTVTDRRTYDKPTVTPPSRSTKPAPRVTPPSRSTKPAPRVTPPSRSTKPAPRVTPPSRSTKPAPRVTPPSRSTKPTPRVTPPSRSTKPAPRVTPPSRSTKPAPRVTPPSRSTKPAPRVTPPSRSSKPAPRVSSPSRSSKPAPRVSSPSRPSKPAPRVSSPPPRSSKPSVSKSPARGSSPKASPAKPSKGSKSKGAASKSKPKRKDG